MDDYALVVNVDAAVVRGEDYLVVRRSAAEDHAAGTLSFPGGKVEPDASGDAIRETARREVREEVDVEVSVVEYVMADAFWLDYERLVGHEDVPEYVEAYARAAEEPRA